MLVLLLSLLLLLMLLVSLLLVVLLLLLLLLAVAQDHLSVYSLMDISLDTFPYSGGSYRCFALLAAATWAIEGGGVATQRPHKLSVCWKSSGLGFCSSIGMSP